GMAPEAAIDKALKRAEEVFAKYPIAQERGLAPFAMSKNAGTVEAVRLPTARIGCSTGGRVIRSIFLPRVHCVTYLCRSFEHFCRSIGRSRKCRLLWMLKFDAALQQKKCGRPLRRLGTTLVIPRRVKTKRND